MKPKQILNIILAVLFVFPFIGTFAHQAANSGSIEVIATFDYPGTGNQTANRKRLTKEATSLAFTSTRSGCSAVCPVQRWYL